MGMPWRTGPDQGIPIPRTSLIGRDGDVARVVDLLLAADVPLVTIWGPGGVGKTRLALRVGDSLANDFRDGVWFVPLSTVHDPELVLSAIAQSLGLKEAAGRQLQKQLEERMRDSEMLLLLDNFEQVRHAAVYLDGLLRACRSVKMLVTSRSILHVSSEHAFPVAGLALPAAAERGDLASLLSYDAVRLFVARAQTSDPRFVLTEQNAESVVGICRQLDGLPLAIELAAARVRTLSPQALQARLSRRLTILGSRFQDLPDRQRSISETVSWSVQLLTAEEQIVFRRMGVFGGAFTEAAAEAVVSHGGDGPDGELFDWLGALVDQSLLRAEHSDDLEEPRFEMLQTIRDVALEHLGAAGEVEATHERHARYFLQAAEEAAPHLTGSEQVRWLNELERDLGAFRDAMVWLRQHERHHDVLRMAVALWRFGYTRGQLGEAREWLQGALASNPERTEVRSRALNASGLLATAQGDTELAKVFHTEALGIARSNADELSEAVALNGLGDVAANTGRHGVARDHYEAALRLFRSIGANRGIAGALTNLGNLVWDTRDLQSAVDLHQQALQYYRAAGDLRGIGWSLSNLGTLAVELGNYDIGTTYLREAIAAYQELVDPYGIMLSFEGFAEIAHARNRVETEATLYAASQAIRERIGMPVSESDRARHEGVIERIRASLGVRFDSVWTAGKMLSEEDVLLLTDMTESDSPAAPVVQQDGVVTRFGLTRRELDVLVQIASGKTNKDISDELWISYRTVSTHVSNMLSKLDLPNRSALAAFAHREGLV